MLAPRTLDAIIVSFGGVGTSVLLENTRKYIEVNQKSNKDDLKHTPLPPLVFGTDLKCVYVYGDPILALASLFRRRYARAHARRLQKWSGMREPIPPEMGLNEYAALGRDLFHFRTHFENWHDRYPLYPTLFVRYESMWENLGVIGDFLGLPDSFESGFPVERERTSSRDDIDPAVLEALDAVYGSFADRLEALPDVEVRQPGPLERRLPAYARLATRYSAAAIDSNLRTMKRRTARALRRTIVKQGDE